MPLGLQDVPPSIAAADERRKRGQMLANRYDEDAERRRKRGQLLASQYSSWADEQEKAKRKRDSADIDAAVESVGSDDWTDISPERHDDWLKRLGVNRAPSAGIGLDGRNPMMGRDRTPPARMYGFDPRGPETRGIGDVIDMRGAPPQAQMAPRAPMAPSTQASIENPLTPEMAAALYGGATPAPRPPEQVAAMYDLGAGRSGEVARAQYGRPETDEEAMRRLWGLSG